MKILFTKSKWEMWDDSLNLFIERVIKDKFDGTELYFDSIPESSIEVKRMHESNGLLLTPEFGPPNYMHTLPFSNKPVGDTWEMNIKMREIIKSSIEIES